MMALFSVLLLVVSIQGKIFGSSMLAKKLTLLFFSLSVKFSDNL